MERGKKYRVLYQSTSLGTVKEFVGTYLGPGSFGELVFDIGGPFVLFSMAYIDSVEVDKSVPHSQPK